ncbi:MAG TPA: homoserine kinase, partial [Actinomycetota bacterium]|nr:homoserine kinase [Actinomycetota bacterium]
LPLVPAARALFEELRDRGVPVCVAGAGPTLLAFEADGHSVPELGPGWTALRTAVRADGATIEPA